MSPLTNSPIGVERNTARHGTGTDSSPLPDPIFIDHVNLEPKPVRPRIPTRRSRNSFHNIRQGMQVIAAVAILALTCQIVPSAAAPVLEFVQTSRECRELEQVLAREQQVNEHLRDDIAYLRSPQGVEFEARRRGWVLRGEVALAGFTPAARLEAPAAEEPDAGQNAERPTVSDRIRELVDSCFAALRAAPAPRQ